VEPFFLMEDLRSMRTLFYQDLCRDQGSCPECDDMTPGQRAAPTANLPHQGHATCRISTLF
jgi:hypothetical protein